MASKDAIIEDVWLVNIPTLKNQTITSTTEYVFASTSLRFDSHVFAYYYGNKGKNYIDIFQKHIIVA